MSLGVYFGLRNRNKHGDSNGAGSNNTSSNNTSSNNTEQGQILRIKKDSILGPVMDFDFPDPCYISVDNIHYAFATNARPFSNATHYNIQIATSKDFKTWEFLSKDALPDAGPWTTGRDVWAPDVVQLVGFNPRVPSTRLILSIVG